MSAGPDAMVGIERLPAIGLATLIDTAGLLTRIDRKYVLPVDRLPDLLTHLDGAARALTIGRARTFRYESVYFDTPGLAHYHAAARRRPVRAKVRTRAYLDSGTCTLEIKTRDRRGNTVKVRRDHPLDTRHQLRAEDRRYVAGVQGVPYAEGDLAAVLVTCYRRSTLLVGSDSRVTIDVGLRVTVPRTAPGGVRGDLVSGDLVLGDVALVETKSPGRPTAVDRLLWSMGHRPVPFSKYCIGLAALHPDLPANRWHRTMRVFAPRSAVGAVSCSHEPSTGASASTPTPHRPRQR